MKRILFYILVASGAYAQTPDPINCIYGQVYTKTTDPNDVTPYSFTPNTINYNMAPNGPNGPTHFDWVNSTYFNCYTQSGLTSPNFAIQSPFYCNNATAPNDGGCADRNTLLYNAINIDNNNQYNGSTPAKLKAMDILPEDGWELLKYSFGHPIHPATGDLGGAEENPWFWLYNRYTGKMKLFVAVTSENTNTSSFPAQSATIKFTIFNHLGLNDIFAHATPITHILEEKPLNPDNFTANCDMISITTGVSPIRYYWLYAEAVMSYDPCTCRQVNGFNDVNLEFDISLTSVSSVSASIRGQLNAIGQPTTSMPLYNGTALNAESTASSAYGSDNGNGSQLINGAKAAMKGYKDWSEYAEKFKAYFNKLTSNGSVVPNATTHPDITKIIFDYAESIGQGSATSTFKMQLFMDKMNGTNVSGQNGGTTPVKASSFVQTLSGLAPLVENLASAVPYIGAFLALSDFLADGGTNDKSANTAKVAAPPTAYALDAKLDGTINTTVPVTNRAIALPGRYINKDFSQFNTSNEKSSLPIYNNPLGVFTIVHMPDFEYKTIPITNNGIDPNDANLSYGYIKGQSFSSTSNLAGNLLPFSGVFDYKLSGAVQYALNPAANLAIKSIDAAYVLEYKGTDPLFLKHNSIDVTNPSSVSGSNPAGFTGSSTGNNNLTQIPYYPNMHAELDPWNSSLSSPYVYSDDLSVIFPSLSNEGLDVDYISDGYTKADGTNAADQVVRIRTRYVPLQSLSSIDFILMGGPTANYAPKIYLKLMCKFTKINSPSDEPVTMVLTYDVSTKLKNAQSTGSGGGGSYNYYYMKDKGNPFSTQKPGDYANFNNLFVYGAYYTPNYGSPNPVNITSGSNGDISCGDINISNNVNLTSSTAAGFFTYGALKNVNIGDNVKAVESGASNQSMSIKAGNNVTVGKGFFASPGSGSGNQLTIIAGNDATFNDSYGFNSSGANVMNVYANHNIVLNQNSAYSNIYTGLSKAEITNTKLLANNEVQINNNGFDLTLSGEVTIGSGSAVPNAYAYLHNDDGSTPITSLQALAADIATLCATPAMGNRLMASADTAKRTRGIGRPEKKTIVYQSLNEQKFGFYPNPTTGDLNISIFTMSNNTFNISVEDIAGKVLMQQNVSVEQGLSSNSLSNIKDFVNGVYIVKISDQKGNLLKADKIILTR